LQGSENGRVITIDRNPRLLHKIDQYGIRGPLHTWLTSFLTERKMRVALEGEYSDEATVDSGVPQGTVLGPILFLCHINDLPNSVKSSVRLFADDCLLYREINNENDHTTLQNDLKNLEKWASDWGMRFNAKKRYPKHEEEEEPPLLHIKQPNPGTSTIKPLSRTTNSRRPQMEGRYKQHL
jgi:hypothetical protein